MNKTVKLILLFCMLLSLQSCSDFFEPENGTIKLGSSYVGETGELYAGFVGLVTKLQAIGDKAIYLTDTRAEMLEPTGRSIELKQLYDYETDLAGNHYADPAEYYDVIIACNDFLQKALAYKEANSSSIDMEHYRGFIGGALRLKAWTYFTIAKIYGEAIWFDDPMVNLSDYTSYTVKDFDQILQSCIELLQVGFDGVDGTHEMSWTRWIEETAEENVNVDAYYYWDSMIPPYFMLAAELSLWNGEYQRVVDLIMPKINEAFAATSGNFTRWMLTASYFNNYNRGVMFDNLGPNSQTAVSVIRYNYERNQTNELLKHFNNEYLLRPSIAGVERYSDPEFSPQTPDKVDFRLPLFFSTVSDAPRYFHKYRRRSGSPRSNAQQDDVHIYIYRSAELYFMLMEAFNHLNRFDEMNALMNQGVYALSVTDPDLWAEFLGRGYSERWVNGGNAASNGGIRERVGHLHRQFLPSDTEENRRHNDIEILREYVLEFAGEGKTYPAMIRMARRYNDHNIIADIVCPKYENGGQHAEIRSKIQSGGYFVHWDYSNPSTAGQQ